MTLQKNNLAVNLTPEEIREQGFVTVVHSYSDLEKMNGIAPHVICKDGDKVVAYLLAMTAASKTTLPVLIPMFDLFEQIFYLNKKVSAYNYIVVGQVCVDKHYRGRGILDACYKTYSNTFKHQYDFAITEIATRNQRSVKAHQRIGFTEIYQYTSPDNEEWSIVVWQW